jgi:hypothetical protein
MAITEEDLKAVDEALLKAVRRQIEILRELLSGSVNKIDEILAPILQNNSALLSDLGYTSDPDITEAFLNSIESAIKKLINDIDHILATYTPVAMISGYKVGMEVTAELLNRYNALSNGLINVDSKALNVLIKDMLGDYSSGLDGARAGASRYFKLTKQLLASEETISKAVAQGLTSKGTVYGAKKELIKELTELYGKGNLIPIKTSSGKIINYRIDTYAELVARTRLGDAQVIGTIEQAQYNGTDCFQVTAHSTKTPICIPHENQILTTNKDLISAGVAPLATNRPVYHVNCQHRLAPYPLTRAEKDQLSGAIDGINARREREAKRRTEALAA